MHNIGNSNIITIIPLFRDLKKIGNRICFRYRRLLNIVHSIDNNNSMVVIYWYLFRDLGIENCT